MSMNTEQVPRSRRWPARHVRRDRERRRAALAVAPPRVARPLSGRQLVVFNAIAEAFNGLSSTDLFQFIYPDGGEPASAVNCVRSIVSRVRRSDLPRGLTIPCVGGRYRIVRVPG